MTNRLPLYSSLVLAVIFLGSCASSETHRQRRIEANADAFESLSEKDKQLVAEGRIEEGMSKEAVFIAWGRPDDKRRGSQQSVPYETWTYAVNQPYTNTHIGLGYGYGYGHYPYGRYRHYHDPYFGFYPSMGVTYRRINVGKVEFLNDKVISWETR